MVWKVGEIKLQAWLWVKTAAAEEGDGWCAETCTALVVVYRDTSIQTSVREAKVVAGKPIAGPRHLMCCPRQSLGREAQLSCLGVQLWLVIVGAVPQKALGGEPLSLQLLVVLPGSRSQCSQRFRLQD